MAEVGTFVEVSESELNQNREDARIALEKMHAVTARVLKALSKGDVSGHTIEVHFDFAKLAPGGDDRDEFIIIRNAAGQPQT